jgi:hypothetical protein
MGLQIDLSWLPDPLAKDFAARVPQEPRKAPFPIGRAPESEFAAATGRRPLGARIDALFTKETEPRDMRNHNTPHLLRPSRAAERFMREPLRQEGSSFAHHALSVLGTLAPLLALAFAVLLFVGVWRVGAASSCGGGPFL